MIKPRRITYNKAAFIKLLKQIAPTFGVSASEAIEDIEFLNNTVVIKISDKRALARKKSRNVRSDVIVSTSRQRYGRG